MNTIQEHLPTTRRPYTPEQLAAAQEKQRQRMAEELGMCIADCEICQGTGYINVYDE